ncbi:MAG TPA: hypothetical protein DEB35_10775 [Desulfuromonas sp.]|nr:hypothetical protein [Desulfuromonas sp.]
MKLHTTRIVILGILLLVLAQPSWARGPAGVSNTIHNLSVTAPLDPVFITAFYRSNEDEVCIFCHTPHGGSLTGPLWNHTLSGATFTHYNSATISTYLQGLATNRPPNDESLLCLSCHDGTISVYSMYNTSNDIGQPYNDNLGIGSEDTRMAWQWGGGGPDLTPDLSNDHPISFSYNSVLASYPYASGDPKAGALRAAAVATGAGVRFFGTAQRVECSSCHDPHVDYLSAGNEAYAPFLVTTNTGSKLCLACHNK